MARRIFHDTDTPPVIVAEPADVIRRLNERRRQEILAAKGVYPLSAPGLPPLHVKSSFVRYAEAISSSDPLPADSDFGARLEQCGPKIEQAVSEVLWTQSFMMRVPVAAFQDLPAYFIPGVYFPSLSQPGVVGPADAEVMVINKIPSFADQRQRMSFRGRDSLLFLEYLNRYVELRDCSFYFTNLLKFVPPDKKNRILANWKHDSLFLLMQEILLVRPKYILCLGAEVARTLLKSSAAKILESHIEDYTYDARFDAESQELPCTSQLMTFTHPSQVIRDPSAERQIEAGLARFSGIRAGRFTGDAGRIEHYTVSTADELRRVLLMVEADEQKEDSVIAVDAEWHGEHPTNTGSYIRTIQFAWRPGRAVAIKFCEAGGEVTEAFAGNGPRGIWQDVIDVLNAFFLGGEVEFLGETLKFRPKRIVGHFFNADLEWLVEYGLNIQSGFSCPIYDLPITAETPEELRQLYANDGFRTGFTVPAWYRTKYEGGADTGLMAHAVEETAEFKLETLAMRYTSAPRYDEHLRQWRIDYCTQHKMKESAMEGYGECPDEVLLPYGMWDADVTLRIFYQLSTLLDTDYQGKSSREAFWESQIATPAVLEIHRTGMVFDDERYRYLVGLFSEARDRLLAALRQLLNWPEFNPRSLIQAKEMLFGEKFNGQRSPLTGEAIRVRPPDARSLKLTPVCDTSKPPRPWKDVLDSGEQDIVSVSSNQKVISSLYHKLPDGPKKTALRILLDYRFMNQALATTLSPPVMDKKTHEPVYDTDGELVYDAGLASYVCGDGRVRTHIYQTKETGRWSSARPNLQNISKKRDSDYKRILGPDYKFGIRGVFKAIPGHVVIEADYVGAELFGMAVLSGDEAMIRHATRNQLPEDHPDYYDIHSNVAVLAFKLSCPPTKAGLKDIGKEHLRIVAKSVVFGFAYGRGARAIAVAAEEEGIDLSVEEAQAVIDAISSSYPRLAAFFAECRARSAGTFVTDLYTGETAPRVITNAFGRHRRFPEVREDDSAQGRELQRRLVGDYGRQAMNFPVQSLVASVVSRAAGYFAAYKQLPHVPDDLFKLTLQIHDALIFQVPYANVQQFCEHVLPYCMRQRVPIWPTGLDGSPLDSGPYYLGIEADVMEYWGTKLSAERATELSIPTGSFNGDGCIVHYSK